MIRQTDRQTDRQTIISKGYYLILEEAEKCVDLNVRKNYIEWKTLGEIGEFVNGIGMPKTMFNDRGNIGAIHYGHIYTKYNLFVEKPIVKVSIDNSKKLKKIEEGNLVIAKTSENIDDIMKTVAYIGKEVAVVGGHAAIFKHSENPRYLSYVFNGASYLIKEKNRLAKGVKVMELSISDMEKIKIPIPSIEVQEYVVSILDRFNELINSISSGLPREIELREKQYEYYREKLLSFEQ